MCMETLPGVTARREDICRASFFTALNPEELARAPSWVSSAPEGTGPHLIPQVRDIPDAERSHLQSLAPSGEEAGIHTHGN